MLLLALLLYFHAKFLPELQKPLLFDIGVPLTAVHTDHCLQHGLLYLRSDSITLFVDEDQRLSESTVASFPTN